MPEQARRICGKVGCGVVIPAERRLCDQHRRVMRKRIDGGRGSGRTRGAGRLRPKLAGWVAARANWLCELCGMPGSEIDHRVPTAEGGSDESGNLQFICRNCHAMKTARENAQRTRKARSQL